MSHGRHGVSNYRHLHCLFNNSSGLTIKSGFALLALCEGSSPVAEELPSQRASIAVITLSYCGKLTTASSARLTPAKLPSGVDVDITNAIVWTAWWSRFPMMLLKKLKQPYISWTSLKKTLTNEYLYQCLVSILAHLAANNILKDMMGHKLGTCFKSV